MTLSARIADKIAHFQADPKARARFRAAIRTASIADILNPAANPALFGKEFEEKVAGRTVAYPLLYDEDRVAFLAEKITLAARGETDAPIHPASAYLQIAQYQEQFRSAHEAVRLRGQKARRPAGRTKAPAAGGRKKAAGRSSSGSAAAPVSARLSAAQEKEDAFALLFTQIEKVKKRLRVPATFARAKSLAELREMVLGEFDGLVADYVRRDAEAAALTAEVLMYRNPDYMHPEIKKAMDEIVAESTRQKLAAAREARRAETLEQEVQRLAEQILSAPGRMPSTTEELEVLRRDYNVLSDKYDTLVSKNIELINRLERAENSGSLEIILDTLRDKINGALRAGVETADDVLLRRIQEELIQLVRARSYLGRALYDMGLLYLRIGRRADAVRELRAARELGVEDPETNRLLNA